jgi:beta-ureidopropionase
MVKIALIQMSGNMNRAKSLKAQKKKILEAAELGAQIICFPELINTGYFCSEINPDFFSLAESDSGHSVSEIRESARESQVVVVYPFFERAKEGEFYNSAIVIEQDGNLIGKYRKVHIPCIYRPNGRVNNEKFYFKPGNLGFPVFNTNYNINIGVLLCYDRHFPEALRALALGGADLVFIPTATSDITRERWSLELTAHAWFNQYYIGGINRIGCDIGGGVIPFFGSSMFIGPSGQIISQADDVSETIIIGEVDTNQIEQVRRQWLFFRDRSPHNYSSLTRLDL